MALAAYRNLLRATRIAFQGDQPMLLAARSQARIGFDKARSWDATSEEATRGVAHAQGVAEILRKNLVQGQQTQEDPNRLRLRIHDEIERGDNDTVKNPLAPGGKVKVGGC